MIEAIAFVIYFTFMSLCPYMATHAYIVILYISVQFACVIFCMSKFTVYFRNKTCLYLAYIIKLHSRHCCVGKYC